MKRPDSTTDGPSTVFRGAGPKKCNSLHWSMACIRWLRPPSNLLWSLLSLSIIFLSPSQKTHIDWGEERPRGVSPASLLWWVIFRGWLRFPARSQRLINHWTERGGKGNFPPWWPPPTLCHRLYKVVWGDFLEAVTLLSFNLLSPFLISPPLPPPTIHFWLFIWIGGGVGITCMSSESRDGSLHIQNTAIGDPFQTISSIRCCSYDFTSRQFVEL